MSEHVAAAAADAAEHAADVAQAAAAAAVDAAQDTAQDVAQAAAHLAAAPAAVAHEGGADLHQALGRIEARVEALHGRFDALDSHDEEPAEEPAPDPVEAVETVDVPAATPVVEEQQSGRRGGVGFRRGRR